MSAKVLITSKTVSMHLLASIQNVPQGRLRYLRSGHSVRSNGLFVGPGTMHTRIDGGDGDPQPIVISAINNDTLTSLLRFLLSHPR